MKKWMFAGLCATLMSPLVSAEDAKKEIRIGIIGITKRMTTVTLDSSGRIICSFRFIGCGPPMPMLPICMLMRTK